MPSHLDGFEAAFVGFGWVVGEAFEVGDHLVQVGEADGEWVGVGELFLELNADLFGVGPEDFAGHGVLRGLDKSRSFTSFRMTSGCLRLFVVG